MACVRCLPQGKLISGINNKVQLFRWAQSDDGSRELATECTHTGHVLALYLDTRGDFVILGAPPVLTGHGRERHQQ